MGNSCQSRGAGRPATGSRDETTHPAAHRRGGRTIRRGSGQGDAEPDAERRRYPGSNQWSRKGSRNMEDRMQQGRRPAHGRQHVADLHHGHVMVSGRGHHLMRMGPQQRHIAATLLASDVRVAGFFGRRGGRGVAAAFQVQRPVHAATEQTSDRQHGREDDQQAEQGGAEAGWRHGRNEGSAQDAGRQATVSGVLAGRAGLRIPGWFHLARRSTAHRCSSARQRVRRPQKCEKSG